MYNIDMSRPLAGLQTHTNTVVCHKDALRCVNIHKIYHTLHRLNLTEDVGPETHGTACCSRAMPPRKKRRPTAGDDLSAKKSRQDNVYRKQETLQIQEAETFSSKRCLEWFYEYAGMWTKLIPCGFRHFPNEVKMQIE
ncbi:hypothetical protein cypCar_00023311 [Cyprinus carpio]|nr:hypothetical protein cypCar_00023311 [Cyprinus carpio]